MRVDKASDIPVYIQIYNNIASEIVDGYLSGGERLPSRRRLSEELGVAQRTVENAYQRLAADEYIVSRPGSGYYVNDERLWDKSIKKPKNSEYNFSTNGVETSKLPFAEWSRLLRMAAKEDTGLFQHGEKAGEWCLRKSIRRMLFKTQGIRCKTEQIIIGPGAEDLLRELFILMGTDIPILMNNYYFYRVHDVAKQLNVRIEYISNGPDGIDMNELSGYENGLLYIKPTHDLPTAVTLSWEQRKKLVEWADENRYIVENSADNSYCYGEKQNTLWELSGGKNVIYLGSFSSTIAPSMKIGYIVAPEELVEHWFSVKRFYANRVSRIEQVTLSKFIDRGHYERHIKYMHDIYREKSRIFRRAVETSALGKKCRITGDDAGMFCCIECDIDLDEKTAKDILAKNGIKLSLLTDSLYDEKRALYKPNTYLVGFGEMTITQIRDGVKLWSKVWERYL